MGFGTAISFWSKSLPCAGKNHAANSIPRLDPMLLGERGEAMRQHIWHEIIDAVRRDVPEVLEVIRND